MKYEILGESLPVVVCELEEGESLYSEAGAMSWMSPSMKMQTTSKGGIGKAFGRMFSGESMFLNKYTALQSGKIAFASSMPGSIKKVDISPGNEKIIQKRAFLASTEDVENSIYFNKNLKTGFFGGEGFIMQKLSGQGMAFIEIDGSVIEYDLAHGEELLVDNGYIAMMDATCSFDVVTISGAKNIFFGGEGLFLAKVTGPGKIMLQTMPIYELAGRILPYISNKN